MCEFCVYDEIVNAIDGLWWLEDRTRSLISLESWSTELEWFPVSAATAVMIVMLMLMTVVIGAFRVREPSAAVDAVVSCLITTLSNFIVAVRASWRFVHSSVRVGFGVQLRVAHATIILGWWCVWF